MLEDLVKTFNIINVRLIVFVIKENLTFVLRNLMKLLNKYRHYYCASYITRFIVANAFIFYI